MSTMNMKKRVTNNAPIKAKGDAELTNRETEPGSCLEAAGGEFYESTGERSDPLAILFKEANCLQTDGGATSETAGHAIKIVVGKKPRQPQTCAAKKKAAFLRAFAENCSVTKSALVAGIDRATHLDWLAIDAEYKAAFEATLPMAAGALEDDLIHWARVGLFEPFVYQGKFQYATRKRTLCKLADGTTAFEDELPQGAKVTERRTVTTRDGERLGVYRRDARLLAMLLEAWMPEKFGDKSPLIAEQYPDTMPTMQVVFDHCKNGKPVGSSIIGPDGRHVWWEPPEGCKKGEPVGDS